GVPGAPHAALALFRSGFRRACPAVARRGPKLNVIGFAYGRSESKLRPRSEKRSSWNLRRGLAKATGPHGPVATDASLGGPLPRRASGLGSRENRWESAEQCDPA